MLARPRTDDEHPRHERGIPYGAAAVYPWTVADAKAPVAIRIVRPYGSPEEFVRADLDTLTRTSITLAGAQPRPKGVVLRFEVTLANGRPVMRGEGRVLGYTDEEGLTLRFTRLDPKS